MQQMPPEVLARLDRVRGAPVDLWVEPEATGGMRATVVFRLEREPPLGVTVHRLFEVQWPFGGTPTLRIPWRMTSVAKAVRFSTVQSFQLPGSDPAVRVEVDLEGMSTIVLEGAQLTIGPVPPPAIAPGAQEQIPPGLQGFDA